MKTAAVIDLDGTLVAGNTFTLYVRSLFPRRPRIILPVLLRKLRLISHARAKEQIMQAGAPDKFLQQFVDRLCGLVRPDVLALSENCEVRILATAAPEAYSLPLGQLLGFTHILATRKGLPENKSEEKCRRVVELLEAENATLKVGATDHPDDSPLVRAFPEADWHIIGSRYTLADF
ncbi:MAG: haloacid dehalogenase-like hydrolase [Duncaniella sp.]|nr:haloacid dehalogenase-like hydrolase [Duncaniella sp.]